MRFPSNRCPTPPILTTLGWPKEISHPPRGLGARWLRQRHQIIDRAVVEQDDSVLLTSKRGVDQLPRHPCVPREDHDRSAELRTLRLVNRDSPGQLEIRVLTPHCSMGVYGPDLRREFDLDGSLALPVAPLAYDHADLTVGHVVQRRLLRISGHPSIPNLHYFVAQHDLLGSCWAWEFGPGSLGLQQRFAAEAPLQVPVDLGRAVDP
jgi:hypothetical protein